jgi:ribosomal protein L14E/L6E/L27E
MNTLVGSLVISKSGHDKNHVYVVMEVKSGFVYVVDGKIKTVDKPKKKNMKHIQMINIKSDEIINKIDNKELRNEDVKRCIKLFKQEHPCEAYI